MPIALATTSLAASIGLALTPVVAQTEAAPGPQGEAEAAADIIAGILAYSRWPDDQGPVTLCVLGATPLASQLTGRTLVSRRALIINRQASAATLDGCNAILVAPTTQAARQALIRSVNGRAIVTIEDGRRGCVSGLMFCLRAVPNGMTFDLDIDAVSRSRVRIDPRVLILARRRAAP